ncbi:MAG: hypothetical protein AB7Q97_01915 [Gammaproteobacteria bacterium]
MKATVARRNTRSRGRWSFLLFPVWLLCVVLGAAMALALVTIAIPFAVVEAIGLAITERRPRR